MLYHKDVGFPADTLWPKGRYNLLFTRHAMEQAENDRYGDVSYMLPYELNTATMTIVEAEIINRKPVKLVVRVHLDCYCDLVLVLAVSTNNHPWFVKTVWTNKRTDTHRTLKHERYVSLS
jgi:hypothetical protein